MSEEQKASVHAARDIIETALRRLEAGDAVSDIMTGIADGARLADMVTGCNLSSGTLAAAAMIAAQSMISNVRMPQVDRAVIEDCWPNANANVDSMLRDHTALAEMRPETTGPELAMLEIAESYDIAAQQGSGVHELVITATMTAVAAVARLRELNRELPGLLNEYAANPEDTAVRSRIMKLVNGSGD